MSANNPQPTASELAQIVASLDSKWSPEEAITRATALWKAADKASRVDEIAAEQEGERREKVGLGLQCDRISLSDAYAVSIEIAGRLGKKAYHNENGFAVAMRKAKLTVAAPIYGKSIEELIKSAEPEMPIVGLDEYTSAKAVEELYRLKAEQRRKRDRKRKAAVKSKKTRKRKIEKIFCGTKERKSGTTEQRPAKGKQSQTESEARKAERLNNE